MKFSYWEEKTWFSEIDFTIVGSGITGLSCALSLKKRYPEAKVLVVERGLVPNGASTKNAGFACFGSMSEILDDLNSHTEEEVVELVSSRKKGLELLRKTIGDASIGYQNQGGYEVFSEDDHALSDECLSNIPRVNNLLRPVFQEDVFRQENNHFGFRGVQDHLIFNRFEGQLDTGKMMMSLLQKVCAQGVQVLNSVQVEGYIELGSGVEILTREFSFLTKKLLVATNGFASQLGIQEVRPARAQVVITKPIPDLSIRGTFHFDRGYYYFRDVGDRVLLGGGRNLAFEEEETTELDLTSRIQNRLEELLKTTILPDQGFEIEQRWSGIMGVGNQKKPIVKAVSEKVYCGVRLGGMGVAIGSLVGKELADIVE